MTNMSVKQLTGAVIGFFVLIAFMTVTMGSWFTVDQGERAVVLRNGSITRVADSGLGFKMPMVDEIVRVSTRSNSKIYEGLILQSKDNQAAQAVVSVSYRIPEDQVKELYANYGSIDGVMTRLVDRRILQDVNAVFGTFTADRAIRERGALTSEVSSRIINNVRGPIIIESVQVESIRFSKEYMDTVESQMIERINAQKEGEKLNREKISAEIKVTQAKAVADSTLVQAKADAEAIKIKGNAEASAIRERGDAIRENPKLVDLTTAEKWNGQLPTTMLPNGSVPMLNLSANR